MTFHIHPVYTEYCGKQEDMSNIHCTNEKDVDCSVCQGNLAQSALDIIFSFPETKFVAENSLMNQLEHVRSEVVEAYQAAMAPDVHHTAIEIWDVIHSCESALRILQKKYGADVKQAKIDTYKKNDQRGYYRCA